MGRHSVPIHDNSHGLNIAPFVFTKTLKRPITILRSWGVRLIVYLDNILIAASSPETTSLHTDWVIRMLSQLGFIINHKKSALNPTQEVEFLGIMVNTTAMTLQLQQSTLNNYQIKMQGPHIQPQLYCSPTSSPSGSTQFCENSYQPSTDILPLTAAATHKSSPDLRRHLQPNHCTQHTLPTRPEMVGTQLHGLEQCSHYEADNRLHDADIRIPHRLGSSLQRPESLRPLVTTGETTHQHARAEIHNVCDHPIQQTE